MATVSGVTRSKKFSGKLSVTEYQTILEQDDDELHPNSKFRHFRFLHFVKRLLGYKLDDSGEFWLEKTKC
jgi:hypothetical protein